MSTSVYITRRQWESYISRIVNQNLKEHGRSISSATLVNHCRDLVIESEEKSLLVRPDWRTEMKRRSKDYMQGITSEAPSPETSATIPANIPGIDYSAATLYGIAPYGNYGFEIVKPDGTAEIFNYSKNRNTNYWYAVTWAEKHTPQSDYNWREDHNTYPRDTIVYEPEWWRADLTCAERLDRVTDEVIAADPHVAIASPENEDLTAKIAAAVARRDLDEGKARFEMFNAEPFQDARHLRDTHTRILVQYALIERETGIPADGDEVEAFYWLRYGRPPYPAIPAEPRQLSLFG